MCSGRVGTLTRKSFCPPCLRGLVGAGYRVSKTLAEKKAWELSKEPLPYFSLSAREVQVDPCLGLRLGVELAVLNPGFVIGWVLSFCTVHWETLHPLESKAPCFPPGKMVSPCSSW